MARTIRSELPLSCERCNATGTATLEEDDVPDRADGGGDPRWIKVEGPFARKDDRFICLTCGR